MSQAPKGVPIRPGGSVIRPGATFTQSLPPAATQEADDNEYDIPLVASAASRAPANSQPSAAASANVGAAVRKRKRIPDEEEEDNYDNVALSSGTTGLPLRAGSLSQRTSAQRDDDEDADNATASVGAGAGALVPYAGTGTGVGAGSTALSIAATQVSTAPVVPARPIAITKHGLRQFVESQHGLRLYLQNCVASCDLSCNPDLPHLATHARNVEYNPRRFAAAITRLNEPKCTSLVFHSGKMVVTGCKNEDDSLLAARKIAKILNKLGMAAAIRDFKIQNIVGTGDCNFPIRLEGLADDHVRFSSYEPELFPGLIYRMESPKIVILVFVSGKIVITGAKGRSALIEGANKIYPILFKYRKAPSNSGGAGAGAGGGDG